MTQVVSANTYFASEYPIDKIAAYSTATDCSPASIGIGFVYTVGAGPGGGLSTYALNSISNPYGKRCLPTLSWSLDQVNWYPQTSQPNPLTQVAAFCGCSDSVIYFFLINQAASSKTVYLQFAVDSPT